MTVIDELVLSLSLDPTKFVKGQKESVAALQKMEEQAKKSGGETETAATKMAEGFERVTKEVLGLGAAFLGVPASKTLPSVRYARHLHCRFKHRRGISMSRSSTGGATRPGSLVSMPTWRNRPSANSARHWRSFEPVKSLRRVSELARSRRWGSQAQITTRRT
jgi:hypothetical protein